jgi:hypothetical protein
MSPAAGTAAVRTAVGRASAGVVWSRSAVGMTVLPWQAVMQPEARKATQQPHDRNMTTGFP